MSKASCTFNMRSNNFIRLIESKCYYVTNSKWPSICSNNTIQLWFSRTMLEHSYIFIPTVLLKDYLKKNNYHSTLQFSQE
uniref:Uncharacterized protein n=1 Tax=Physcomitrium patens TaxID=3218 RepID=A0A2K1L3Y8_PHYPA|nr:hypothetical protein PHYPA_003541 [Physcomitrium patens]